MLLLKDINLNRSNRTIFKDINISLSSHKIVTLKGKNGSGKTSLIKIMLNILHPTSGSIYWKSKVLDKNLYDYYNNVTYISDHMTSIKQLSVLENIKIWKKMFLSNISNNEIEGILTILNIKNFLSSKVYTLSLGEVKKLELLRLIIEGKKIWLLDEPLTNLDEDTLKVIEQTFKDHCMSGGSILFSTHQDPKIDISEEINL